MICSEDSAQSSLRNKTSSARVIILVDPDGFDPSTKPYESFVIASSPWIHYSPTAVIGDVDYFITNFDTYCYTDTTTVFLFDDDTSTRVSDIRYAPREFRYECYRFGHVH